jgi:hypothetical protein
MSRNTSVEREYLRLAEKTGIADAHIERGNPHARLVGKIGPAEIRVVISLSRGAFSTARQKAMVVTNFRRAVREVLP